MKALKNDSVPFVADIIAAVQNSYAAGEPSNTELTKLYHAIGKNICERGEKAFVVHLAEMLAERFPAIKGFSARNLRRMRDFYCAYENKPRLLNVALELGWTQNAVILDCCETDDTRAFYLVLAKKENLSKLALMSAIEKAAHEQPQDMEKAECDVAATVESVCGNSPAAATNTESETKSSCEPPVTACEPFLQGSGAFKSERENIADNLGGLYDKRHLISMRMQPPEYSALGERISPVYRRIQSLDDGQSKHRLSQQSERHNFESSVFREPWQPPKNCAA